MDFNAHDLHNPELSSSMQGNNGSDVVALQSMLAAVRLRPHTPAHAQKPSPG